MENNPLPIANSPQTTNAVGQASLTVTQPLTVDSRPKANNFLVVLLSVLLFISVSIAGFFAYQTQKLVKELTMLKTSPTPEVTTEPVATIDPTTDWKTYTNNDLKITMKYPANWIVADQKDYVSVETDYKPPESGLSGEQILRIQYGETLDSILAYEGNTEKNPKEMPYIKVGGKTYSVTSTHFGSGTPGYGNCVEGGEITSYIFEPNPKYVFTLSKYNESGCLKDGTSFERRNTTDSEIKTVDQILSTFKFTN